MVTNCESICWLCGYSQFCFVTFFVVFAVIEIRLEVDICVLSTVVMAVPPAYADLGKSAKDIFDKGYGTVPDFLME